MSSNPQRDTENGKDQRGKGKRNSSVDLDTALKLYFSGSLAGVPEQLLQRLFGRLPGATIYWFRLG